MLALLALVMAPAAMPSDGWVAFEQPAVAGIGTMGCAIDRKVTLREKEQGMWMDNPARSGKFDRFTIFMELEDGELKRLKSFTPDCDVEDAGIASRVELGAAEGVAVLADHMENARRKDVSQLVAVLAHIDHPRVDEVLAAAAADLSREQHGDDALFWLARRRGERGRAIVNEHLGEAWPLDHREQAVMALALSEHPAALETVRDMARNADAPRLRAEAVTALGIVNAPGALADLHSIFLTDSDSKVREQVIFALAQLDHPEAARTLATIVRDPRHAKHRREALFWLAQMDGDASEAVLDELVEEIF